MTGKDLATYFLNGFTSDEIEGLDDPERKAKLIESLGEAFTQTIEQWFDAEG